MEEDDPFARQPKRPSLSGSGTARTDAPASSSVPAQLSSFGLVGDLHTCQEQPTQFGWQITRNFGSGVQYRKPQNVARGWSRIDDFRYQLIWPEAVPSAGPPTLFTWAERVAELPNKPEALQATHEQTLAQLDRVLDAYLEAVEQLHHSGMNQGLIHPKSVLLLNTGAKLEAVLPDVGFIWRGEFGMPPWLQNHPGNPTFYSSAAADRQLLAQIKTTEDRVTDLQLAAKLIRFVLLGGDLHSHREIPDKGFWQALNRRYESASEFRQALQINKPSKGFQDLIADPKAIKKLSEPDTSPRPGGSTSLLVPLFLIITLLGVGGLALWLYWGKTPTSTTTADSPSPSTVTTATGKPTSSPPTPPPSIPKETGNLLSEGDRLVNGFQKPPADDASKKKLDADRASYVKRFDERLNEIWEAYGKDNNSGRAEAQLRPLVEQMRKLTSLPTFTSVSESQKKEKACIAFAVELLQQLQ